MQRNVVLVTVDSLRADHCGFIDPESTLTPTLDSMAEEGVVFENAIAPGPRTPSSMPVVFTGEFMPIRDGEGAAADYWEATRARIRHHLGRHLTLAERFDREGYETIGVTVNPWTENTGFDRGFDAYYDLTSEAMQGYGSRAFRTIDRAIGGTRIGSAIKWFNKRDWFIRWVDYYELVRSAVDRADRPYFLWVFLLDTHQPYIAPGDQREESSAVGMYYSTLRELLMTDSALPPHVQRGLGRAYRDAIRSIDGFVDRLVQDTRADDPIVIVHSDHGEAFGAHGTYGHERQLYRENLHVPLLVYTGADSARIGRPVSLARLPQIAEQCAVGDRFDARSVTDDFALSMTEDAEELALSGGRWRYIDGATGDELFDVVDDPEEGTELAGTYPELTNGLAAVARQYRSHFSELGHIGETVRDEGVSM